MEYRKIHTANNYYGRTVHLGQTKTQKYNKTNKKRTRPEESRGHRRLDNVVGALGHCLRLSEWVVGKRSLTGHLSVTYRPLVGN